MNLTDAEGKPLNEGELVVYPGQGLCRVVGEQEVAGKRFLMLELTSGNGMKIGLPVDQAAKTLKRPMSREEAEAAMSRLLSTDLEPDNRPWPYRYRDATKALARGPASARVEELLKLYRLPFKPSYGEQKMLGLFEDVVLNELASSLGTTQDALKEKLAAVHPIFSVELPERPEHEPTQPPRPTAPFELPGHEYLGSFRVEETLVIAEPGATLSSADQPPEEDVRHNLHVKVKPGHYLAFVRHEDGEAGALIAVHEQFGHQLLTLTHEPFELAKVIVEGGRVAMLDEKVRNEREFVDEMEFPVFPTGLILDRGAMCGTGGDGQFPVLIGRPMGETVLVVVEF